MKLFSLLLALSLFVAPVATNASNFPQKVMLFLRQKVSCRGRSSAW